MLRFYENSFQSSEGWRGEGLPTGLFAQAAGAELSLAHLNTLALRQPPLASYKGIQIRAINRSGVIRNVEEGTKEPDKVQGQCRVGISFTRITEYTQALCNALLTIPIQAWSRLGLIFLFPFKNIIFTPSV